MRFPIVTFVFCLMLSMAVCPAQNTTNFPVIGHVDRFDESVNQLIDVDARIEVLCGGFEWAEGPVWVPQAENRYGGFVLFSDIPNNAVMRWQEGFGVSV
ncbi:MAG: SMP-30/gluconolactonase/LRE family protein, partial [Planctomycetaceae bacterium]|nr:SMP-30/gluconolactonase/LRE family protein [Planctomycetaceae bacterium]